MNKSSLSPAQARYRMRFSMHQVPDSAKKSVSKLNRMWLGRAMAFVAVFSMVLSSFNAPSVAIASQDKDITVCHYDNGTWTNLQIKQSQVGVHANHDADFVINDKDKKCPGEGTGKDKMVVICHYDDGEFDRLLKKQEDYDKDHKSTTNQSKNHPNDYLSTNGLCGNQDDEDETKKVIICHANNSDSNVYVEQEVNVSSILTGPNGHDTHNGPVWFSGIAVDWGDIIPPFSHSGGNYLGKNWTAGGQAIYNEKNDNGKGCNIPESEPDPCLNESSVAPLTEPSDEVTDAVPAPVVRCNVNVTIKKVWEGATAPDNKDDISIAIDANDDVTCEYNGDNLECYDTVTVLSPGTMTVTETGIPAGWEVDPTTVGTIQINCLPNAVCEHTIVNNLKDAEICGTELVLNGGFEAPVVNHQQKWNVFDSGTTGMGWSVDWVRAGGPNPAKMELHRGVNGWDPNSGAQYTELDSDWEGPSGGGSEDASATIFQDLVTKVGSNYTVSLWTSPRPGQGNSENVTEVKMGATVLDTITEDGSSNSDTVWTKHTYSFTATSGLTRLSITDKGTGNTLGGFVDDVSVIEECESDVTICKYDDNENPLSGWDVFLKGPLADTVTVNSTTGVADLSDSLTAGEYVLEASGTYTYRPGSEGDISDAAFSKRIPSDASIDPSFYAGSYLPWVRNLNLNGYEGYLGIRVDNTNFDWGSAYADNNKYSAFYTLGADGQIPFSIIDNNYSDNSGSLTVKIYPVVKGKTGVNGCVTLENVEYGNYTVDELMQEGWDNESGQNAPAVLDQPTEEFNLVNVCESEKCRPSVPQLHFIKVVCDQYSDVAGNKDADNEDDTEGNYTLFNNYDNDDFNPSPLVNGLVSPTEIPGANSGCNTVDGWQFKLSDHINQLIPNNQLVGPTVNGEFVTPISGEGSALSPEMQTAIVSGQLWVSEVEQDDYDFAAIRCYKDALNGDNLEYISLGEDRPDNIYCIAYNINTAEPCVIQDPAIASGTSTYFKGLATLLPSDLKDVNNYPNGPAGYAVAAGPTGYPGAWDGPQNDPNITEGTGFWVSNSAAQPTNPAGAGGDGSIDTWRLFSHTFTIPADAASISPATLYFSADNEVTAFLDDVQVGTNNSFATAASAPLVLTPGQHTLKFAVKNWAFQPTNNPTGLIYNLDFTYCGSDTTQGEPEFHVSGMKWNDDGDGVKEEESGIEGWAIHLTRKVADFDVAADSSTGTDTPVLVDGKTYFVKATGTFDAGDSITADAQYSDRAPAGPWTDLVQAYESYGPELLDLQMNSSSYDWGMYNSAHTYWLSFISNGTAANFKINDVYYPNNTGSLNVEVYEVIETDYTDSEGDYHFNVTGLGGDLYVVEGMVEGWHQTAPVDGVYQVTGGQNSDDKDFGNHQVCMQQNYDKKVSRLRSLLNILVDTQDEGMPYCGNGISGTKTQTGTDDNSADGWTIYLDLNHNNALDDGEPYDVTDSDGDYSFSNLPTGTYHVREANQEGWTQTVPGGDGTQIVDVFDSVVENIDFTNNFTDGGGNNGQFSIAGKVYHDNNSNNGTLNDTEEGLQTWVVYLDEDESNTLNGDETSVNTDSNGNYLIEGLASGCYTVREVTQPDWVQTEPVVEDNEYHIGLGGAIWPCNEELVGSATNSDESGNGIFGFLFKTANAADLTYNFPGNAIALNFGNIEADRGGSNGGGGSSGSRPNPPGRVLGDSTTTPSTPQVLGAVTLPVTGSPTWVLLMIALFAAPMLYFRKLAVKRA